MKKFDPTPSQKQVIEMRGRNMLVSASAGTGKTTTMIERIVSLISEGADISDFVVVTFTNPAAAEMKAKLAERLSEIHNDARIAEQLERLDSAAISTLHSFCGNLLRNYFYVVDIDPAFAVLDEITTATLRKKALNDLFDEYFRNDDPVFRKVYKIFSTSRQEENFRKTLMDLYDFSRCLPDFAGWYEQKRQSFLSVGQASGVADKSNAVVKTILEDISSTLNYYIENLRDLARRGSQQQLSFASVFDANADALAAVDTDDLQKAFNSLWTLQWQTIPNKTKNMSEFEQSVREHYDQLKKDWAAFVKRYSQLCRGESLSVLESEMAQSVELTDKLAEMISKFDELFQAEKRQLGGVDFNDLEHFTLRLLDDPDTLADIRSHCKFVFVDEYQDTNPVQEEIVRRLAPEGNLFMVGDVKQSIYGFRGCEPDIFVEKRKRYLAQKEGEVIELNENFRSNREILEFVNNVFDQLMTESFGKVNYRKDARLVGTKEPSLKCPSVRVDLIAKQRAEEQPLPLTYDITAEQKEGDGIVQGDLIAYRIKQYVGKVYFDEHNKPHKIDYGDVVILMRTLTDRAVDIYDRLIANNIPVATSFKVEWYASKEIRDIITLLRVVDNPYDDIHMVGACMSFGGFSENDLVPVRLHTSGRKPFFERLTAYAEENNDAIAAKARDFLKFVEETRFFARSAAVHDTVLRVMEQKNYALKVQSLNNGELRLSKLFNFVNKLKDSTYAQSVDKFLVYVDETEEKTPDIQNIPHAVRMMTMHKSKGLEFPVVIIAGMEGGIKPDYPALKANIDLGIAVNFYDFDSMRTAETLGAFACERVNLKKEREEALRLLYVAMTRAKMALELVAAVDEKKLQDLPKQTDKVTTHLEWLRGALYHSYPNAKTGNGVEINVVKKINDDKELIGDNLCEQTENVYEVRQKMSFVYPYAAETQMPSKVVSSALDKEFVDLTDEPQEETVLVADADRNQVGTAYHKVYQYAPLDADIGQITDCIAQLVNDGKVEARFAEQLDVELIFRTLNNPELRKLLQNRKVYHEIPFMLYAPYRELYLEDKLSPEEVMLQGVIDLLAIGDNDAVVIDFKYTSHPNSAPRRYAAQLNSYRMAVQRICGIRNVDCYILSVADNRLLKM